MVELERNLSVAFAAHMMKMTLCRSAVVEPPSSVMLFLRTLLFFKVFCLVGSIIIAFFFLCARYDWIVDYLVVIQALMVFGLAFVYPSLCWILTAVITDIVAAHVYLRISASIFLPIIFLLAVRNRIPRLYPPLTILFASELMAMSLGLAFGMLFLGKFPQVGSGLLRGAGGRGQ